MSVTRLRLRSVRFVPLFALRTWRSLRQVRKSPGFQTGAVLNDRHWAFWTMTVWDSEQSMRQYMVSGAHKEAMRHLMHWCDEASVAHWTQAEPVLLPWAQADARMRQIGRASKVIYASPQHAGLTYAAPRTTVGAQITRS